MNKNYFNIFNVIPLARSLIFGLGLTYICKYTTTDLIITWFIGTLLSLLILKIINNKQNKYLCIIINTIIIILLLMSMETFITSFYLINFNSIIITSLLFILCIYLAKQGINVINRVNVFIFIINTLIYLIIIISLLNKININHFLPILNTNYQNLLISSISYSLFTVCPLISIDLNISLKEKYLGYIISSLTSFMVFIITLGILGPNIIEIYRYPEYMVLKEINIFNFLTNIENIIAFIWGNDIIISITLLLSNIKKIMKPQLYYLYLIFIGLIIISKLLFNPVLKLFIFNNFLIIFLIIFGLLLITKKFN